MRFAGIVMNYADALFIVTPVHSVIRGRATIKFWLFSFNVPEIGVFRVYILVFNLEKSFIVGGFLPQLVSFTTFYHISPFGSEAQNNLAPKELGFTILQIILIMNLFDIRLALN